MGEKVPGSDRDFVWLAILSGVNDVGFALKDRDQVDRVGAMHPEALFSRCHPATGTEVQLADGLCEVSRQSPFSGGRIITVTRTESDGPKMPVRWYSPRTCSGVTGNMGSRSNPQMLTASVTEAVEVSRDLVGPREYRVAALGSGDSPDLHRSLLGRSARVV